LNKNRFAPYGTRERINGIYPFIDFIEVLTGTDRTRKYWSDLKAKLKKEGSELSEKI
jgi:hypothetical protein